MLNKYFETNIRKFDTDFMNLYAIYDQYLSFLKPGAKVLEIGPGNGGFGFYIRGKYLLDPKNMTMLDISESVIQNLKKDEHTADFNIILSDVFTYLEQSDKCYDLVILRHVLEHFEKKEINKLIPLLEAHLSESGKILVEVPNMANVFFGNYMAFGDYSHFTFFTDKSLREAFYWNSDHLKIECYNSWYHIFNFRTAKWLCVFFIGFLVEFVSSIFSLATAAYGNKIFSPRLVAVISKKHE